MSGTVMLPAERGARRPLLPVPRRLVPPPARPTASRRPARQRQPAHRRPSPPPLSRSPSPPPVARPPCPRLPWPRQPPSRQPCRPPPSERLCMPQRCWRWPDCPGVTAPRPALCPMGHRARSPGRWRRRHPLPAEAQRPAPRPPLWARIHLPDSQHSPRPQVRRAYRTPATHRHRGHEGLDVSAATAPQLGVGARQRWPPAGTDSPGPAQAARGRAR